MVPDRSPKSIMRLPSYPRAAVRFWGQNGAGRTPLAGEGESLRVRERLVAGSPRDQSLENALVQKSGGPIWGAGFRVPRDPSQRRESL